MDIQDWIQIMVDRIVQAFQPERIQLFGSHARGQARPESDVDLLVVLAEVPDKRGLAVRIRRILAGLPVAKDILVTSPEEIERRGRVPGSILRSALADAVLLYERA